MSSSHRRNTAAMLASPRCGAWTRSDGRCRSPAVKGKKRCRMHGGAQGSGAPKGNRNAFKHGTYTKAAFETRAWVRQVERAQPQLLKEIEQAAGERTLEALATLGDEEPPEMDADLKSDAHNRADARSSRCDLRN
jgi:hypothetical protein